jgi:hypothetical protein
MVTLAILEGKYYMKTEYSLGGCLTKMQFGDFSQVLYK